MRYIANLETADYYDPTIRHAGLAYGIDGDEVEVTVLGPLPQGGFSIEGEIGDEPGNTVTLYMPNSPAFDTLEKATPYLVRMLVRAIAGYGEAIDLEISKSRRKRELLEKRAEIDAELAML